MTFAHLLCGRTRPTSFSLQYTGTSNLSKGSNITGNAPRKSVLERASGLVEKGVKTAQRYVHENFLEDTRQLAIDTLLGGGQRAGLRELVRRESHQSDSGRSGGMPPITLYVATWNVNGKVCSPDDLDKWLGEIAPGEVAAADAPGPPGMYIIGFQVC